MSQFIELNRAIQILSDEHDAEYPTENDRYMATREALIQAAQATPVEPVAWANSKEFHDALTRGQSFNGWHKKYSDCDMALYATTPPAEPTPEMIEIGGKEIAEGFHADAAFNDIAEVVYRAMIGSAK